jgi:uncharacterized membrane protein
MFAWSSNRDREPPQHSATQVRKSGSPEVLAYAASFLQIGIMWANHHTLFRIVERVDQLLLLANLRLLGFIAFLPLPTRLIAQHTSGDDGRTAMLLYGATLTGCALHFNLIWQRAVRRNCSSGKSTRSSDATLTSATSPGWSGCVMATLLAFVAPWLTVAVSAALALLFLLGPSPRSLVDRPPKDAPAVDPHDSEAPR